MSAQNTKISLKLLFIFIFLVSLNPSHIGAQAQGLNTVRAYPIQDTNAQVGDIISRYSQEGIFSLSRVNASQELLGVIVDRAETLSYYEESTTDSPVASDGVYKVNVNTIAGAIVIGDYVGVSEVPGKGQKSERDTELIIGKALENFDGSTGTAFTFEGQQYFSGSILVDLGKTPGKYETGTLRSAYQLGKYFGIDILKTFQTTEGASQLFKYLIVLAIMIGVLYMSFRHFGHSIANGVQAIGRNPLAKNNILSAILINAVMIIVVSLLIVLLSIVIIRL